MKFSLVFASCVALANASPIAWSTDLAVWYRSVSQHIQDIKLTNAKAPGSCDLSGKKWSDVMMSPDTDLYKPNGTLATIVLGRGVQNYTCDATKPNDAPKAVGAIANLYDVSCYGNYPDLLHQWPAVALNMPMPQGNSPMKIVADLPRVGHHYFNAAGVPTFDLNDSDTNKQGVIQAKPVKKIPAPVGAPAGQFNSGNGAVMWLLLKAVDGSNSKINTVYRIDTAGGNPPATCQSSPATFSVEYSTLYFGWVEPTS